MVLVVASLAASSGALTAQQSELCWTAEGRVGTDGGRFTYEASEADPDFTFTLTRTPGSTAPGPPESYESLAGPLAIPDNDGDDGVSDTIVVPDGVTIADLDVEVEITHTYLSDLVVVLVHDGVGAVLWGRACGSLDDLQVRFDDEGPGLACGQPTTGTVDPTTSGGDALSVFDGMSAAGEWTLIVYDLAPADTGTLDSWGLRIAPYASPGAASVRWTTNDLEATAGEDYVAGTGILEWEDGDFGDKTFDVALLQDDLAEPDERFEILLSELTGDRRCGATATLRIEDDELGSAGTLRFETASARGSEGAVVALGVSRTGGTVGALTAEVTVSGVAALGSDFTYTPTTLTWMDGETGVKEVRVELIDDGLIEGSETATFALVGAAGVVGMPGELVLTIDDPPTGDSGTLRFTTAARRVSEVGDPIAIGVERTGGLAGPASVEVFAVDGSARSGSDYEFVSQILTWQSGEGGVRTATLEPRADQEIELAESLTLRLRDVSGATLGSPSSSRVAILEATVIPEPEVTLETGPFLCQPVTTTYPANRFYSAPFDSRRDAELRRNAIVWCGARSPGASFFPGSFSLYYRLEASAASPVREIPISGVPSRLRAIATAVDELVVVWLSQEGNEQVLRVVVAGEQGQTSAVDRLTGLGERPTDPGELFGTLLLVGLLYQDEAGDVLQVLNPTSGLPLCGDVVDGVLQPRDDCEPQPIESPFSRSDDFRYALGESPIGNVGFGWSQRVFDDYVLEAGSFDVSASWRLGISETVEVYSSLLDFDFDVDVSPFGNLSVVHEAPEPVPGLGAGLVLQSYENVGGLGLGVDYQLGDPRLVPFDGYDLANWSPRVVSNARGGRLLVGIQGPLSFATTGGGRAATAGTEQRIVARAFAADGSPASSEFVLATSEGGPITDFRVELSDDNVVSTTVVRTAADGTPVAVTGRIARPNIPDPPCDDEDSLCLQNGRFQVTAVWRDAADSSGRGEPVQLTSDTGYFWFFDPDNVEVVIKVLDACSFSDRLWVFAGGLTDTEVVLRVDDLATGQSRSYTNQLGEKFQPIQDTGAFATCDGELARWAETDGESAEEAAWAQAARAEVDALAGTAGAALRLPRLGDLEPRGGASTAARPVSTGACVESETRACLNDGRFAVDVSFATRTTTGTGKQVRLTSDTGYFWFFDPDNVEIVLKVLDACVLNDRFWVFAGGLTDTEVRLTVTDTVSGVSRVYDNAAGTPFQPIQDTAAFATCF